MRVSFLVLKKVCLQTLSREETGPNIDFSMILTIQPYVREGKFKLKLNSIFCNFASNWCTQDEDVVGELLLHLLIVVFLVHPFRTKILSFWTHFFYFLQVCQHGKCIFTYFSFVTHLVLDISLQLSCVQPSFWCFCIAYICWLLFFARFLLILVVFLLRRYFTGGKTERGRGWKRVRNNKQ